MGRDIILREGCTTEFVVATIDQVVPAASLLPWKYWQEKQEINQTALQLQAAYLPTIDKADRENYTSIYGEPSEAHLQFRSRKEKIFTPVIKALESQRTPKNVVCICYRACKHWLPLACPHSTGFWTKWPLLRKLFCCVSITSSVFSLIFCTKIERGAEAHFLPTHAKGCIQDHGASSSHPHLIYCDT